VPAFDKTVDVGLSVGLEATRSEIETAMTGSNFSALSAMRES
jgi:hypothetical protein